MPAIEKHLHCILSQRGAFFSCLFFGGQFTIADLFFDLYGLDDLERQLVSDMSEYGIEFFSWSQQKQRQLTLTNAVKQPSVEMLERYAETFIKSAAGLLRLQAKSLSAVVYKDSAPLSVVGFEIAGITKPGTIQVVADGEKLRDVLRRLDRHLLDQRAPTLYMRRHVRIYDGSRLYFVRPSERRFWTQSQALADFDGAVTEWLSPPVSK